MADPDFGNTVKALHAARGTKPSGRPRSRDKHGRFISEAMARFAEAMPEISRAFIDELKVKQPETCPHHGRVLRCPETGCGTLSSRVAFDHKAAAYAIDRVAGKPVTRSANAITVAIVRELGEAYEKAFLATNTIEDAAERQRAFAQALMALRSAYDPNPAIAAIWELEG